MSEPKPAWCLADDSVRCYAQECTSCRHKNPNHGIDKPAVPEWRADKTSVKPLDDGD